MDGPPRTAFYAWVGADLGAYTSDVTGGPLFWCGMVTL
jgi:hypothetical protein